MDDAAEGLWSEETDAKGVVTNPFSEATNQQKLDVIDVHIWTVFVNLANTHKSQKAQTAAREAAAAEKHDLD